MTQGSERVDQIRKAIVKHGEKLVIGHLKQTFNRHFRKDLCFDYANLGRQGSIMYSNCTLEFQQLHMEGIRNENYVATMIESQQHPMNFSPWSSGAGFYVSRYSDFAALWSWVSDPKDSVYKNLECQGWHGELIEPVTAYARSIGKLEERLKHSGEVLSKIQGLKGQNKKGGGVLHLNR